MNPGYICGGVAVTLLVGVFLFDFGYRRGFRAGQEAQAEEKFREGYNAADKFWISAEDGVEAARKELWKEELGA